MLFALGFLSRMAYQPVLEGVPVTLVNGTVEAPPVAARELSWMESWSPWHRWVSRVRAQRELESNPISLLLAPGESQRIAMQRNADTVTVVSVGWQIFTTVGGTALAGKVSSTVKAAGISLPAVLAATKGEPSAAG